MVTDSGITVPSNTVEIQINPDYVIEVMTVVGTITAGMGVSYTAGSNGSLLVPSDSATSVDVVGIALDNHLYNSSTRLQYDYDDAYPANSMVRVALKGGGHLVTAIAKGSVTAGNDVIATTTIGELVDGVTAGAVVGKAQTDATDARFVLSL